MEILCVVNEIIETMFFYFGSLIRLMGIIFDTIRPLSTRIIVDIYIPWWEMQLI